ncbi:MAG: adenylate/guanylate cyclase domain-containing protein, partial [Bacteroidota bacterium]
METAYSMFNTLISNGVFFGVLFIIALYHLMLYFSIRERAYLYYTLYVLTVGLGIMVDGILSPFTTISLSGIEWFYVFYWLITLISIFYYLFAQAYLKTKELLPKWHRYIFLFIGFKLVVVLLGFLLRIWTGIPEIMFYTQNAIFLLDVPFLLGLSAALINHKIPGRTYFIIGSLLVFCVGFLSIGFRRFLPVNPFILFLLSFLGHILVYSLGLGNRIRKDQQEKLAAQAALNEELQKINQATARFVPHEFLRSLGRDSVLEVSLGDGVEKEVSVLFADIRGYTSLSEQMSPRENFEFLNHYLGRVGPIIQTHAGFVNQYYGDGVMALFQKQAQDAVNAAIEMHQAVHRFNLERKEKSLEPIQIGIGLHTGSLMMGIMGDQQRMEAGVVSDAVNTAARMEGLTKLYGASLIISGGTFNRLVPEA